MKRPRNPRRVTLEILRVIKKNVSVIAMNWDITGTLYGDGHPRARRIDEYPENRPEDWRRLIAFMSVVETQARDLKEYAIAQLERVEAEQ